MQTLLQFLSSYFCFWSESLKDLIDGLAQGCTDSIANVLELLQPCTKPLIMLWWWLINFPTGWAHQELVRWGWSPHHAPQPTQGLALTSPHLGGSRPNPGHGLRQGTTHWSWQPLDWWITRRSRSIPAEGGCQHVVVHSSSSVFSGTCPGCHPESTVPSLSCKAQAEDGTLSVRKGEIYRWLSARLQ